MTRIILPFILALGVVLPAPPPFAISVVQVASGRNNDVAVTFGGAWNASNHIVVVAIMNSKTQTLDLTGITPTETVLAGPIDHATEAIRAYLFCFQGDGSDTSFTATTSGSGSVAVAAVEIAGGSCTLDGSAQSTEDATSPYALTTDITTTQAGSFIIGMIHSSSVSDYTVTGSGTSEPSDGTDLGPVALGQHYIAGAAGAYDTTYTSAAAETSLLFAGAIQAAGGGAATPKRFMLHGIGGQ